MIWSNIYPADAHQLKQFRKVARKSEEVGPPCFRETSQHFGGTCKPATVSKGYRSTKSLGNPGLQYVNLVSTSLLLTVFLSFKFSINWATSSVDDGNIKKRISAKGIQLGDR